MELTLRCFGPLKAHGTLTLSLADDATVADARVALSALMQTRGVQKALIERSALASATQVLAADTRLRDVAAGGSCALSVLPPVSGG